MTPDAEHATDETAEYLGTDRTASRFYEREPRVRLKMNVAGKTHPGLVRPNNEDHYVAVDRYRGRRMLASSLPEGLFEASEDHAYTMAVADGLGGHKFGELASLLALRTGWELGGDEIKWPMKVNREEIEELKQKAEVFFKLVNDSLLAEIRDNPRLAGMGTTLTICYSMGPNLFVLHAGDSRAYLHRQGKLRQLTRDHNLGQILVDAGEAEPGSELVKRMRHVVTNVLGNTTERVEVDLQYHMLAEGDRILVCTDGLSDLVDDAQIARLLTEHPIPKDACQALVDTALANGGTDNVTVVVAHYELDKEAEAMF
jgi:protein phosphatase